MRNSETNAIVFFESDFWRKNKKNAQQIDGKKNIEYVEMGLYAIAKEDSSRGGATVYQINSESDYETYLEGGGLVIDDYKSDSLILHYAEDDTDFTKIEEGFFDSVFSERKSHIAENDTDFIFELRIGDVSYYRAYNKDTDNINTGDISFDSMRLEEII